MGVPHNVPLKFSVLTFKTGLNITVRAGDKWLGSTGLYDAINENDTRHAKIRVLESYLVPFNQLNDNKPILNFINNPETRTYSKLFQAMRKHYPGRPQFIDEPEFKQTDMVTVVYFHVTTWGTAHRQEDERDMNEV
jgi:hypothetical protein